MSLGFRYSWIQGLKEDWTIYSLRGLRVYFSLQDHHCSVIESPCPGLDCMSTLEPVTRFKGRTTPGLSLNSSFEAWSLGVRQGSGLGWGAAPPEPNGVREGVAVNESGCWYRIERG